MRAALLWALSGAWAAGIFAVSHLENLPEAPGEIPHLDKLAHAGVYAVLAALVSCALSASGAARRRALVLGAVAAAAYGATDEFHQVFVPGREASLFDWAADACGAGLFAAWWALMSRRFPGRTRRPAP